MIAFAARYEPDPRDECEWKDYLINGRAVCVHFAGKVIAGEDYGMGYHASPHVEQIHLDIYDFQSHEPLTPQVDYTRKDAEELEGEGVRRLLEEMLGC